MKQALRIFMISFIFLLSAVVAAIAGDSTQSFVVEKDTLLIVIILLVLLAFSHVSREGSDRGKKNKS